MRTSKRLIIVAALGGLLALPAMAVAQGRAVPRGGGGHPGGPAGGGHPGGGAVARPPATAPYRGTYRPPYYPYAHYGYPHYGYPYYGYGYRGYYPGWSFSLYYGYPWYVGPYGFGFGVGYGYGYPGYYGYPYGGGYYGYPGYAVTPYGGVRIIVPQRNAEVYVDGYYAGVVNDFDGTFQQVNLEPGPHHIEVRAEGFAATAFDVQVTPGRTVTYRAALQQAQP